MSVTQYIGARYVPLFADPLTWDITKAYEALTIVYYQGNSFTSRQAVPAGIDITNDSYWALTGNYNAQIEQYRAEVQAYDGRITANTASNTAQDAQLAGTSSSGLKTLIEANASDIDALELVDTGLAAQLAGTSDSGLKTLIDANTAANTAQDAQLAGTSDSGLKTLLYQETQDVRDYVGTITNVRSGGIVAPSYIGDFMENGSFGCCCRAGNRMYAFSYDGWNGYGDARIFDMENNILLSTQNILVGHANSCAYDSVRDRIWIVPMSTYSSGTATDTNAIYYYNEQLSSMSMLEFSGETMMWGVSFDPVTENLYAFATYSSNGPIKVYKMASDESSFTLFTTVSNSAFDTSITTTPYTFQDFAVYNDVLYAAKPEGTTFCIDLADNNKLIWTFRIGMSDIGNLWRYGEIEGIEFDANGHLYNARNALIGYTNTGVHGSINCAFVTELNMPWIITQSDMSQQTVYGSLTLTTANTFHLNRDQIRSLNQLNWRNLQGSSHAVIIPAGTTYEDGIVRLQQLGNLFINVLGTMRLTNTMHVFGTNLLLQAGEDGTIIGTAVNFMDVSGFGTINFRYRTNATVTMANRFVYTGYTATIVNLQGLPSGMTLKVNEYDRGNSISSGNYLIKDF